MLPKSHRLTNNRIAYLLKKGQKKGNNFFTIKYRPNRQTHSRFCVVTSIKISPKAVVRNRLRRQIYEVLRLNPQLPAAPTDIVIFVKNTVTKLKFAALTKAVLSALQHLIQPS